MFIVRIVKKVGQSVDRRLGAGSRRAFLFRSFINWDRFEKVPLGKFTWFSFLDTSLLSVAEHPDNWAISILCWFVYNGLMYWKKSILFLIITHGITNLALYIYVIWASD